jgi:D-glycero-alpha-D-manno-heptose-7-phosphate kinase
MRSDISGSRSREKQLQAAKYEGAVPLLCWIRESELIRDSPIIEAEIWVEPGSIISENQVTSQTVRSRAPLRLGLAGGGTDVSPYSELYGGNVLNAAIDMYAYCTISTSNDGSLEFHAADLGESWTSTAASELALEEPLVLHKAIYNRVVRDFNDGKPLAVKVTTSADAPPGSGLGTSSTMVVAILRAYQELLKLPLGEYDLAQLAYDIERKDCGLAGGKQDQYVATFGGFNFMEFFAGDRVIVNPLRIRVEIINEIECGMLLYFTGRSRESANIIKEQIQSASSGDDKSLQAMHRVRQSAVEMKEALLKAEIKTMAKILGEAWRAKRDMAQSISNPLIDRVYDRALAAGALSAKISGAGGGGFMMLFVEPTSKLDVIAALSDLEGSFYRFHFTKEGAQGWSV